MVMTTTTEEESLSLIASTLYDALLSGDFYADHDRASHMVGSMRIIAETARRLEAMRSEHFEASWQEDGVIRHQRYARWGFEIRTSADNSWVAWITDYSERDTNRLKSGSNLYGGVGADFWTALSRALKALEDRGKSQ
jgi:hypothetical protein